MRFASTQPAERRGFTVIELLVVIAIIGILVALTASAVVKVASKGPEMDNISTIRQLAVGVESFKAKFGVYPPSQIYLANNMTGYTSPPAGISPQLVQDSLYYLQHLWPHIDLSGASGLNWGPAVLTDLTGNPVPYAVLEGDQCLVFFLGGMCDLSTGSPGMVGFSTNPKNPTAMPANAQEIRIGPFFDFLRERLTPPSGLDSFPQPSPPYPSSNPSPAQWQPLPPPKRTWPPYVNFPTYKDSFGVQPYAYFSSGRRPNGYNMLSDCPHLIAYVEKSLPTPPYKPVTVGPTGPYWGPVPIMPYANLSTDPYGSPTRFYNPNTFQILSAGKDLKWGWPAYQPSGPPLPGVPQVLGDFDDMSNFSSSRLGAPVN